MVLPSTSRRFGVAGRTVSCPTAGILFAVLLNLVILGRSENLLGKTVPDAEVHSRRGLALAHSREWAKAEQELTQAAAAAPSVALYHAQLASILGLEEKWNDSRAQFSKAVELEPNNLSYRREAAAVQWRAGALDGAEKNLLFVLKQSPQDPGALLLLGLVSEARGDYAKAATLLSSQMDLVLAQPDRLVALVTSLIASGRKEEIGNLVGALQSRSIEPQWANAISRCVAVAAKAGELDSAESLYSIFPEADRKGRQAAALPLATLLYRQGKPDQAQRLLSPLLAKGWSSADAERLLGDCLEAQHQNQAAIEAYSRAIALEPTKVAPYDNLITLQIELGKAADALDAGRRVVALAPKNARAWVLKGNAELHLNLYKDALLSYRHAGALDQSDPDTALLMGGTEVLAGQNDAAIAAYQNGIQRFPNDARFYIAYAEALLGSHDSADLQTHAQALLSKAVQLAPGSAEAHYQLGQIALQQNRLQDAEKEFATSLAAEPNRSKAHYAMSLVYRRMGRPEEAQQQFVAYESLKQSEEHASPIAVAATP